MNELSQKVIELWHGNGRDRLADAILEAWTAIMAGYEAAEDDPQPTAARCVYWIIYEQTEVARAMYGQLSEVERMRRDFWLLAVLSYRYGDDLAYSTVAALEEIYKIATLICDDMKMTESLQMVFTSAIMSVERWLKNSGDAGESAPPKPKNRRKVTPRTPHEQRINFFRKYIIKNPGCNSPEIAYGVQRKIQKR